ncbi:MAG: Ig-like domain-containing protein [Muribaculaceae bacterium]|nr:Ig-like domain-containing protein [Muribaculaceae bacterium]
MRGSRHILLVALLAVVSLAVVSCANIGSPEGGPRDYTPPMMLRSTPVPGAVNFKGKKIEINFDEIITLKDQTTRVVVSPAPKEQPIIRAQGKKIVVEFQDELEPNTTYVIDFTDAIEDNNEGNVLDGFSFAFSTGDHVDSLQVSGMVLRASDLEPMRNVLVGLHSNLDDSAFTTLPFDRVSRTNSRGEFTLRNVAPGEYHIFALRDADGDYKMARTEDIAFLDQVIVPTTREFTSQDTVFTFDQRVDTIMSATHTEYLPNDLLLTLFNENHRSYYLKKNERLNRNQLFVLFSAPLSELPTTRVLEPAQHLDEWHKLETREAQDSLVFWLTDSAMIKADTIRLEMTYLYSDDNDSLTLKTDTLTFAQRRNSSDQKLQEKAAKEREKQEKELAKLEEKLERLRKEGKDTTDVAIELEGLRDMLKEKPVVLKITTNQGSCEINDSLWIRSETPIGHISMSGFHLEKMNADSTWTSVDVPTLEPSNQWDVYRYVAPMKLEPNIDYRVTIDSLAIESIYGIACDTVRSEFKLKGEEEYANLHVNCLGFEGKAYAQLLDKTGKVVQTVDVLGSFADFFDVPPETYYVMMVLDANGNGRWDTGNYAQHLQPEDVFYFHNAIKLKKFSDVTLTWNIYDTPVDKQKPEAIRKFLPEDRNSKLKKKETNKPQEEEEDEFNSNGFLNNRTYSGNKYDDVKNGAVR